ncbi:hypothetical protein [Miltoncostaea marina]|uniref:hypothetical protein n=1 Tax=Miltoncostaea marina TaxID=2843215 RepID=UPI001C3D8BCB|nr:hypothetical protein [Miltoncostaea marina]
MGWQDWDWSGDDDRPERDRVWVGLRDGAFLGQEDGVRKRGLVSLNAGWLARGGLLRLYADRLEFEPNPLERLLGARRRRLPFAEIARIERRPERPDDLSPVGQTPRMRLHLAGGPHLDVLPAGGGLDDWLAAIREAWAWHARVHGTG